MKKEISKYSMEIRNWDNVYRVFKAIYKTFLRIIHHCSFLWVITFTLYNRKTWKIERPEDIESQSIHLTCVVYALPLLRWSYSVEKQTISKFQLISNIYQVFMSFFSSFHQVFSNLKFRGSHRCFTVLDGVEELRSLTPNPSIKSIEY